MVAAANTWGNAGAACNNQQTQAIFYSSNGGATWDYTCAPSNNVMALGTCSGTVFGSDPALYWNDSNEVFLNYMLLCSTVTSTQYAMVVARSDAASAVAPATRTVARIRMPFSSCAPRSVSVPDQRMAPS